MPQADLLKIESLPPGILEIIQQAPVPGLDLQPKCARTAKAIETEFRNNGLAGTLVEAGLWLLAGELDRSHEISQSHKSAEGSFWHGIMHRREGDFWNSKYWFRQAGKHSVHSELASTIDQNRSRLAIDDLKLAALVDPRLLPASLVDYCEWAQPGGAMAMWRKDLELITWWEWQLLFGFEQPGANGN